jgi:tartrate-resistant acid phosphatase type 5
MLKNLSLYVCISSIMLLASCKEEKTSVPVTTTSVPAAGSNKVITSKTFGRALNFFIVSDWGWSGYNHQQEVADQMSKTGDSVHVKFIISCGDNFQTNGVASPQDPLWMSNYENVYKGLPLLADWYPVLGNHDYHGNPQAEIDYSKISRRWRMTDHYYTFSKRINDSVSARFIFLDTPPLVAEYHKKALEYPEIDKQDTAKQMKWLKDVLSSSKEQWILVFGHHPIYSASKKHGNTQEMIDRVKPLLEKYHAEFYFCGHDHDFQHLHEKGHNLEYIVTGTGGETRPCSTNEMSLFSRSDPGFTVVSLKADSMRVCFVGTGGNMIYSFGRVYR